MNGHAILDIITTASVCITRLHVAMYKSESLATYRKSRLDCLHYLVLLAMIRSGCHTAMHMYANNLLLHSTRVQIVGL